MDRVVPHLHVRLAIVLVVIVMGGVAVGSRLWLVGGEETSQAVRVTYQHDYEVAGGLVIRGQRDECVVSWPASTMDVKLRDSILMLTAEDGMWIWTGSEDEWSASGLPDPCAGRVLSDG